MLEDIRNTSPEEYWETLRKRWGALLTYKYIGRQYSSMNSSAADDTVVLRSDMRNAAGGLLASVLSCCAPGGGGPSDLEAVPNPVINSIQLVDDGRGVEKIRVVDSGALKVGARMYFGRARIVDDANPDRTLAYIDGQGAAIGKVPEGLQRFDDDPVMHIEDSPDLPPLWKVYGGMQRADGHWGLSELRAEFASPDAALHVGPQFVIHEVAALDLATKLAGTDQLQTTSFQTMFLARGKTGPFRVDGKASQGGDGSGRIGVQLTLHDEGEGDRMVSAATVVLRRAD